MLMRFCYEFCDEDKTENESMPSLDELTELDPIADIHLYSQAKNPHQILASLQKTKNFPIPQDGSCNGLQHISSIISDARIGQMVNISNNKTKADLYQNFANSLSDQINLPINTKIQINRNILKYPILAMPYGISEYGCIDYMSDHLKNKKMAEDMIPSAAALKHFRNTDQIEKISQYLGYVIFKNVKFLGNSNLFSLKIREIVELLAGLDIFLVYDFLPGQKLHVRPNLFMSNRKNIAGFIVSDQPNPRISQKRAKQTSVSSIIHMLDSYHMRKLSELCFEQNIDFFSIHDSTFCREQDLEKVNFLNRQCFIEIYQNDQILQNLKQNFVTLLDNSMEIHRQEQKINGQESDDSSVFLEEHEKYARFVRRKIETIFDEIFDLVGDLDVSEVENNPWFFS